MGCSGEIYPGCLPCFRIFINAMTIAALVMSLLTVDSCQFFDFKDAVGFPDFGGGGLDPEGSLGLFRLRVQQESCMDYPQSNFDVAMKTARVGAVIGVAAGALSVICTVTEATICAMGKVCTCFTSSFMIIALLGQCLAYSIFATEQVCDNASCSFGQGAAYNTAAFSLYFVACIMVIVGPAGDSLWGAYKKKRRDRRASKAEQEKVAAMVAADHAAESDDDDDEEKVVTPTSEKKNEKDEPPAPVSTTTAVTESPSGEPPAAQDPPGEKTSTQSAMPAPVEEK